MIPAPSGSHLRCLKCVKTYGKHFIDPKSSEFCPFFKFFLVRRKLPKLLLAHFLKKPRYPCPFEILEETLYLICLLTLRATFILSYTLHALIRQINTKYVQNLPKSCTVCVLKEFISVEMKSPTLLIILRWVFLRKICENAWKKYSTT
jgi:hypothetical protein